MRIEIQKTETDWQAKIFFRGISEFGFMTIPYGLKVPFDRIKKELQLINPKHVITFI